VGQTSHTFCSRHNAHMQDSHYSIGSSECADYKIKERKVGGQEHAFQCQN